MIVKNTDTAYNGFMNIKDRLSITTVNDKWREIAKEYDLPIEFAHFCQAENMDGKKGEQTMEEARKILGEEGFRATVGHGPFNEIFPAAIDSMARAFAMKRLNMAAERLIELGIKKMVVHSGYIPFVYFKEWHRDRSVEFWQEFMADKPTDFKIAIENVLDDDPYTLRDIAAKADDKRIGLCLDVGHANIVSQLPIEEWIEEFGTHLSHWHLHNNDGKGDFHKDVFAGSLNMENIMELAASRKYSGASITIETIEGGESLKWLKERGYI